MVSFFYAIITISCLSQPSGWSGEGPRHGREVRTFKTQKFYTKDSAVHASDRIIDRIMESNYSTGDRCHLVKLEVLSNIQDGAEQEPGEQGPPDNVEPSRRRGGGRGISAGAAAAYGALLFL